MVKEKNMNIRITENEYSKIKQFAEFNGKSISALVLDAVREQIELWEDLQAVRDYEQDKTNGSLVTYSLEDIMAELELRQ